jgi:hypothetical protein
MLRSGEVQALQPPLGGRLRIAVDDLDPHLSNMAAARLGDLVTGRCRAPRAPHPWLEPPPLANAQVGRKGER